MIKVIGKIGCSSCEILKAKLTAEGTEFEYSLLEDLNKEEKRKLVAMARNAGNAHMPLVFKDGKSINLG